MFGAREGVKREACACPLADDVSGLGSTRIVRFGFSGGTAMNRTALLQDRRMQSLQEVGHWQARRLSSLEAVELPGMSGRSFRRY